MENLEKVKQETGTGDQILFGMPRLGTSIVLGIESWAVATLYSSGFGLSNFLTWFAIAMGYFTIAITQFLLGWLSDTKYTK